MVDLIHRGSKRTMCIDDCLVEKLILQRQLGDSRHRVIMWVLLVRYKYGHML